MLKFFRDQKNGWLLKGILILTALSFVSLFRTHDIFERIPDENKALASVARRKITMAEFVNEFHNKVDSMRKLSRGSFTYEQAIHSGMMSSVLNEMASKAVSEASSDTLGLVVSDEKVREEIAASPAFAGYDGLFSYEMFKKFLNDMGLTEKHYINDVFVQMKIAQLTDAASKNTKIQDSLVSLSFKINEEKRTADVFAIKPDSVKIAGEPSKADQERLYNELSETLIAPEYRTLTVMALTPEIVATQIVVPDDELLEIFNETKDSYTIEEKRNVDQMLFETEEQAQKAYDELKKGAKFMTVAKETARQTKEQTQLGEVTPSTATGEWADTVFALKKGQYTAPIETAFGWQILRVNSITPKIEKKFKDVRNELKEKVVSAAAFDKLQELSVALDDKLGAGEGLEHVSKEAFIPLKTFVAVDPSGQTEKGEKVDLPKDVLITAFSNAQGQESAMIEDGTAFYVVRVDDIREPVLKTMEQSQKEIKTAWVEERQKLKAKQIAEEIEKRLKKGESVQSVKTAYKNVKYKQKQEISRRDATLPVAVTHAIFSKSLKEPALVSTDEEYFIVQATKITPADPKKDKRALEKIRHDLEQSLAAEKSAATVSDFGRTLDFKMDEDMIAKAFSYLTKASKEKTEEE